MRIHIGALTLLTLQACLSGTADSKRDTVDPVTAGLSITTVKTRLCIQQSFIYDLKCQGKIRAAHEQVWIAENAGIIQEFSGYNGRHYREGEVIALLDQYSINMKLERAELARFNAQREYESQLIGYHSLLEGKSVAQADSIKKKLRINSGLAMAEQDIKEAHEQLERTTIKASFNGVLADVNLQKGNHFNAGDPLFTFYSDQDLYLETGILETDLTLVKKGLEATIVPISDNKTQVKAVVDNIDPYVDSKGMVRLELRIAAHAGKLVLFPGMHCSANLAINKGDGIVIPKIALVKRDTNVVVFTYDHGFAKWNNVKIGNENGQDVEILNGLSVGEKVIVSNNIQLINQSPVQEELPN